MCHGNTYVNVLGLVFTLGKYEIHHSIADFAAYSTHTPDPLVLYGLLVATSGG